MKKATMISLLLLVALAPLMMGGKYPLHIATMVAIMSTAAPMISAMRRSARAVSSPGSSQQPCR